jgi:riboflavin synthase
MFTGIVEELGSVAARDGSRLRLSARRVLDDVVLGASIAVNGCCLTVAELGDGAWGADVVPETLSRTALGGLAAGDAVNLERPVRLADRLGGHLVQGHVDGVGRVVGRDDLGDGSSRLRIDAPDAVLRYVVVKGSVAVDGVSLTVAGVGEGAFEVALVPHTIAVTTLGSRRPGDEVNLEADVVAKYVERLLPGGGAQNASTSAVGAEGRG